MINQKGAVPVLILVAVIGVIAALVVTNLAPFKNKLLSSLFPKSASQAATLTVAATDWPQLQKDAQKSGNSTQQIDPINGSYSIKWTWNTNQTNPVRFSRKAEPIVAYGTMFLGGFDGNMYAVNASNGQTSWTFPTGGSINSTAATDAGIVVFGSDDSNVYAVDAANGNKIWSYATGAGFDSSPLIVNGIVYIGSKDGNFYAFNLNPTNPVDPTTVLKWKYQVGSPIYNSAAYSSSINAVLFGAEDMYVYTLNIDGTLKWKSPAQVPGRSFKNSWPVVSDSKGVAIFRTMPSLDGFDALGDGDSLIRNTNDPTNGCPVTTPDNPAKWTSEQTAITNFLQSKPYEQTFTVLNLSNGSSKFIAPVLYTTGSGSMPTAPVIAPDSNALVIFRSCYSQFDNSQIVRDYADLGKMDLGTGAITHYTNPSGLTNIIRLIGDESSTLSLGGNNLFVSNSELTSAYNINSNVDVPGVLEGGINGNLGGYNIPISIFPSTVHPIYSSETATLHLSNSFAPPIIAGGMIIWKSDGSGIVALIP